MTKENEDLTFRLQYLGYCLSNMVPDGVESNWDDFIRYARYQLCFFYKRPFYDPIWDSYTTEQIAIEYYAMTFSVSKDEREKFELSMKGLDADTFDWFDSQIAKNKKERKEQSETQEDEVSFSPDELGD